MNKDTENKNYRIQTVGECPAVKSIDTVALYDKKTGMVVHLHEIVMFEGAKTKTKKEVQTDALDYAERLGCKVESVSALYVPNFQADAPNYQVNLKTKTLKALSIPSATDIGKK